MVREQVPAAIVSVLVLLLFGAALGLMLTQVLPAGNETMLNIMVGTLGGMSTAAINYWIGSTAGSQGKDRTIARNAELLAQASPVPLLPAPVAVAVTTTPGSPATATATAEPAPA